MAGINNNDTTTSTKVKRVLMYGNSDFRYLKNFINRSADPSQHARFKKNLQNFCLKRDQVDLYGVGGIKTSHLVSGEKKKGINIHSILVQEVQNYADVRFFQDYEFSLPGECKLRYDAGGNNYKPDGIHLNDGGLKTFYSAVRALVTSSD